MRIAFVGSRGIPASYSGFETFVEQLGARLAARGHTVTVYNRSHHVVYNEPAYKGVELIRLPTIATKHLDTIVHTFLATFHAAFRRYDILYFCGVGNSPLCAMARLFGLRTILNVDAADWRREKWRGPARAYLRLCERIGAAVPHAVIADSRVIQDRYKAEYSKETVHISYGAGLVRAEDTTVLRDFALEPQKYILFAGRLVPENNAHLLIRAHQELNTELKLVILGDAPYSENYKSRLRHLAGPNVVFTGYQFGETYRQISSHALFFVLASRVDGTRPVLLEQMGVGNCVLVSNSPANMETIGSAGCAFDGSQGTQDLKRQMEALIADPARIARFRILALERAREHFSWDAVTDSYEQLFRRMTE